MWDINRDDKSRVEAKCPQCSGLMADMGKDFASPKSKDVKRWNYLKTLYSVGIAFHSCGCTGPGYIPNQPEALVAWFNQQLFYYQSQLNFFRQRKEPATQRELDRENSKNWRVLSATYHLKNKKGIISNQDGINFWLQKIYDIEAKINIVNTKEKN
jgi:hypothetical protein